MPLPTKVKTRIAALPALLVLLGPPVSPRAQDAPQGAAAEAPARPATIAGQVLAPLPEPVVILEDFTGATAENTVIEVFLAEQRLVVRVGGKVAVRSPVTTGRKAAPTPEGEFAVKGRAETLEPDAYGNFCDKQGHVLIAGVFENLDSPPRGTRFIAVARKYTLEVEGGKTRILAGHVRSTPSTEGTVVVPEAVAWALYEKIPDGAKVRVLKENPEAGAAADPATSAPPAP